MTQPGGRVHVVGAGLAGLAAAVELAAADHPVALYEAGPQAGGRCRSFLDGELGVRIDNGNHLLLAGNTAAMTYVERIAAFDTFERPLDPAIPFVDLSTRERWALRPSLGAVPWWVLDRKRRVPGTWATDYLGALRFKQAGPDDTVAGVLSPDTVIFRRLWEPLAVAALNTAAADGSARLFWNVLAETLGRGAAACQPLLAREGLSESLVDPALSFLARRGGEIRFGARLRALGFAGRRAAELLFDNESVGLAAGDSIVLAVPAAVAARLVPGLVVPDEYAPIVNAHFRMTPPADMPELLGVVGGTAEWVFKKRAVVSVTVSAADGIVGRPAEELRDTLWRDVALALDLADGPAPPARIVKERRATFRATPAQLRRRPASATSWNNLHLAGDYLDTGLPATIEGAIRSGFAAAARVRRGRGTLAVSRAGSPAARSANPLQECQRALP